MVTSLFNEIISLPGYGTHLIEQREIKVCSVYTTIVSYTLWIRLPCNILENWFSLKCWTKVWNFEVMLMCLIFLSHFSSYLGNFFFNMSFQSISIYRVSSKKLSPHSIQNMNRTFPTHEKDFSRVFSDFFSSALDGETSFQPICFSGCHHRACSSKAHTEIKLFQFLHHIFPFFLLLQHAYYITICVCIL